MNCHFAVMGHMAMTDSLTTYVHVIIYVFKHSSAIGMAIKKARCSVIYTCRTAIPRTKLTQVFLEWIFQMKNYSVTAAVSKKCTSLGLARRYPTHSFTVPTWNETVLGPCTVIRVETLNLTRPPIWMPIFTFNIFTRFVHTKYVHHTQRLGMRYHADGSVVTPYLSRRVFLPN